jgi:hypothetical protein
MPTKSKKFRPTLQRPHRENRNWLRNDALQHRPDPGRVSVVNSGSATIFDTFVCYPEPITITNTDKEFSGIGMNDVNPQNSAQPFSEVQAHLVELLRDRIVIGHDIQKDLKVISIYLPSHILRLQRVGLRLKPPTFA